MTLSSIIDRAIDLNTIVGVTDQPGARTSALSMLKSDAGAVNEAIVVAVTRLIHVNATRGMRALTNDPRQKSLFGLRSRYAIDENFQTIKDTERLSELELDRVISIREKQLTQDSAQLNSLRAARSELKPIWREYPAKLFGEVERIYIARRNVA